jgi:hypothetical protein
MRTELQLSPIEVALRKSLILIIILHYQISPRIIPHHLSHPIPSSLPSTLSSERKRKCVNLSTKIEPRRQEPGSTQYPISRYLQATEHHSINKDEEIISFLKNP